MASKESWEMISDYFSPQDFGEDAYENVQDSFLRSIYKFRVAIDNPMIIHPNGGYTTYGHSKRSYHYRGRAIDFHFIHKHVNLRRIIITAIRCGLYGIGIYPYWRPRPGGFHLDNRHPSKFEVWYRTKDNIYVYLFDDLFPTFLEDWNAKFEVK